MKKTCIVFLFVILLTFLVVSAAFAQGEGLTLRLSRDFGYGGFNGDIQGTFSMHASGPSSLVRVEFYLDSTKVGESNKAPFTLQFNTDVYPNGVHTMSAIGYTADGQPLRSNVITANFVPASVGNKAALSIVIPILVIVLGIILLATVIPLITGRKTVQLEPGAERRYPLGGGVCPRCERPFAFHVYGMHFLGNKFDRCPYCGRWSFVKGSPLNELRAAELAELAGSQAQVAETSEEEKLKKELDDSKYQGL